MATTHDTTHLTERAKEAANQAGRSQHGPWHVVDCDGNQIHGEQHSVAYNTLGRAIKARNNFAAKGIDCKVDI